MWDWDFMAAWCFSHELFKWITLGFLAPTAVWAWGQSEQRDNTPLSTDLKLADLRGQTPVSTGASPSQQVQDPAPWMVSCPFGLGGSTAVKEENMWVMIGELWELQFSLPAAKPGPLLIKIFWVLFWRTKVFECNAPPQFLRWNTPFFH